MNQKPSNKRIANSRQPKRPHVLDVKLRALGAVVERVPDEEAA